MMYDITMCRCACSRRHTCHRWLQFRRFLKDPNTGFDTRISMHSAEDGQIDDNCPLYWAEKEDEK